MPGTDLLAKGAVQRIGEPLAELTQRTDRGETSSTEAVADHRVALGKVVELLTSGPDAPLRQISEIGAVGHRVVHGGEHFTKRVMVTEEVIAAIEAVSALAPLHNPPALLGIRAARDLLPDVPQVAAFAAIISS